MRGGVCGGVKGFSLFHRHRCGVVERSSSCRRSWREGHYCLGPAQSDHFGGWRRRPCGRFGDECARDEGCDLRAGVAIRSVRRANPGEKESVFPWIVVVVVVKFGVAVSLLFLLTTNHLPSTLATHTTHTIHTTHTTHTTHIPQKTSSRRRSKATPSAQSSASTRSAMRR